MKQIKTGLREHLQKSEVEYIARHGRGYPETFQWDKDIEAHARRIGFRVKEHFTVDTEWIRFYGGVCVCLEDGFCGAG